MYRRVLKSLLDRISAIALLLLFAPLLVAVGAAVRVLIGPSILFRQPRPGLRGRLFTMLKFRTMEERRDEQGLILPDAVRLTRAGRWLRSTSLDELPELINVLKGDMSLVGPRPLLTSYLERYSPEQARRHEVKPGITGWAQVNGRNALSWEQKFKMDVWYVDHVSLGLDLRILWRTLAQVITRKEINHPDAATAPEFSGTEHGL